VIAAQARVGGIDGIDELSAVRGDEQQIAGPRVVQVPVGMDVRQEWNPVQRHAREHLDDAGGDGRQARGSGQTVLHSTIRGLARIERVGVHVFDAAVGREHDAVDAAPRERVGERHRRRLHLAHAVIGGDDEDAATPPPPRAQVVDEPAERPVCSSDGLRVVGAVGAVEVTGPVDVGDVHHGEVRLGRRRCSEQRVHRRLVRRVSFPRRPEDVRGALPPGNVAEEPGELRLRERTDRHQRRGGRLDHREQGLDLDERRVLELRRRRAARAVPPRIAGDAVGVGIHAREKRHVVRVRARRHHGVRPGEERASRMVLREHAEERGHVLRGRSPRVEAVDDDQVHVRPDNRRGARTRPARDERDEDQKERPVHRRRVDGRRAKS
jgi:hypothetical protein